MISHYTERHMGIARKKMPGGLNKFEAPWYKAQMDEELPGRVAEIYDKVLEELRKALNSSKLIEEDLADLCDVKQSTINRIKSGKRGKKDIPFRTVLKLAIGLKVDLPALFYGSDPDMQTKIKALLSEITKMIANQ